MARQQTPHNDPEDRPMTVNTNGAVVYDGPSAINGQRIVAILTGLKAPSKNVKTGSMTQLWILSAEELPTAALKSGKDESICGDCPLRGILGKQRSCYVQLRAPQAVWKAWQRGSYGAWDGTPFRHALRLGAYGDPAALPLDLVQRLVDSAPKGHTGYSHQWRSLAPQWKDLLMASVETPEGVSEAHAAGWRTFRVLPKGAAVEDRRHDEIICPATPEGGLKTTCANCRLCSGASPAKSVTLLAHGAGAKHLAATV